MTENAGTPNAGNSGNQGGNEPQPISVSIPPAWMEDDNFKGFFKEENGQKAFDLEGFQKHYLETKQALPAVPETSDAYKFEFPEGWPLDEAAIKVQREMAKAAGLTQAQYEQVVKHDVARLTSAAEAETTKHAEAVATLRKEWGQKYDGNVTLAKKAAETWFGKGVGDLLDHETNPAIIRGLYAIASKMGEDTLRQGGAPEAKRPVGPDGRPRLAFKSMGD
jgi:hypothetical protein